MFQYKNILFCTDYSEDADIAFVNALRLVQKYGARLHVIHVLDSLHRYMPTETIEGKNSVPPDFTASPEMVEKIKQKVIERYQPRLGEVKDVIWTVVPGVPFVEILRYAREKEVDLIVMGASGESVQDQTSFLSTVGNVSRRADCHVMAIRNPEKAFTLKS